MKNKLLLLLIACLVDLSKSQECTTPSDVDPFLSLPDGPFMHGDVIVIECSSGTPSEPPVIYCLSGSFTFPLEDVTCSLGCESPIADQESLSIVGEGAASYLHHDMVSFECATNYQEPLTGPTSSTCNNGTWEPDPSETRCKAPCPAPLGSDQEGTLYLDGQTANLTCRLSTNEAILECNDGVWFDTTFSCPVPDCVMPDDIDPNVLLNSGSTEFFSGDFINVTCSEGSTLVAGHPVTYCLSDGSFTISLADVVCSFSCQSPPYAVPEGTYASGDSERFSCEYGDGASLLLTCNGETGEWDQILECPELPTTMNSGTDLGFTDNSTATTFTTEIETESVSLETTYMEISSSTISGTDFATDAPSLTDEETLGSTVDTTGATLDSTEATLGSTHSPTSIATVMYTSETTLPGTGSTAAPLTDFTSYMDTAETTLPGTGSTTAPLTDFTSYMDTAETTLPGTGSTTAPLTDFTSYMDTAETTTPTQMDTDITVVTTGDVPTDITSAVQTNTRITVTDSITDMPTEEVTDLSTIGSTSDVTFFPTPTSSVTEAPTDLTNGPGVSTGMTDFTSLFSQTTDIVDPTEQSTSSLNTDQTTDNMTELTTEQPLDTEQTTPYENTDTTIESVSDFVSIDITTSSTTDKPPNTYTTALQITDVATKQTTGLTSDILNDITSDSSTKHTTPFQTADSTTETITGMSTNLQTGLSSEIPMGTKMTSTFHTATAHGTTGTISDMITDVTAVTEIDSKQTSVLLSTDVTTNSLSKTETDNMTKFTTDINEEQFTTYEVTDTTTEAQVGITTDIRTRPTTGSSTIQTSKTVMLDITTGDLTESATDFTTNPTLSGLTSMGITKTFPPTDLTTTTDNIITTETRATTDPSMEQTSLILLTNEYTKRMTLTTTDTTELTTNTHSKQTTTILATDMTSKTTGDGTETTAIEPTTDVQTEQISTDSLIYGTTKLTTDPNTKRTTSFVITDMTTQPTLDGTNTLETKSTTGEVTEGPTAQRTTRPSTTGPTEEGSTVLGVTWVIEEVNGTSANYTDDLSDPTSDAYQDLVEAVESAIIDLLRQQLGETSLVGIRINGFYPGSIIVNFTLIFNSNFTGNASVLQALLIEAVTSTGGFVNGSLSPTVLKLVEELISVIDITPPSVTTVATTEETFSAASDITEIIEITETERSSTNRMTDLITESTTLTLTDLTTGTDFEQTSITDSSTEPVTDNVTDLVTDLTTGSVTEGTTANQETDITTELSSDSSTDTMTEATTDMDTEGRVTGITTELLSDTTTDTDITTDTGSTTDILTGATTDLVSEESTTNRVTGMTTDSSTESTLTISTITTGMETGEGTTFEAITDMTTDGSTDGGLTESTTATRTEGTRTTRRSTTSPIEEGTSVFDVTWVIEEINGTEATYTDDLNDPTSQIYQTLAAAIESAVEELLNQLGETSLIGIDITGFSSGSIRVDFTLTFSQNSTLNATYLQDLLIQAVTENGGFVNTTTILRLIEELIRVTDASSQRTTMITEQLTTISTDSNSTEPITDTTQTLTDSSSDRGTVTMGGTERTTTEDATNFTTPDALTTENSSYLPTSNQTTSRFSPLQTEDPTEGTVTTGTSNTLEQSTPGMTTGSVSVGMNITNSITDMTRDPMTTGRISSAVTDGTPSTDITTDRRTDVPSSSETMSTLTTTEAITTATTDGKDTTTAKSATTYQTPERTTANEQTTGAKTTKAATEPGATTKAATTARTEPCGSNTCGPQEFCLETESGSVCDCLAGKERGDNGECTDGCNNVCDFDTEVCETNTCTCRPGRTRDMNGACSNFVEFYASWTIVEINGTEATFTDDLDNPNSQAYQMLAEAIQNAVRALLVEQLSEELGAGTFINVQITGFQSGSIISSFTITFTSALSIQEPSALRITIYNSIEENNHYANDSSTSTALRLVGNSGSVSLEAIENSECGTAGICGENAVCVEVSKSDDPDGFICECIDGFTDVLNGRLSGSLDCREAIMPTEQPSSGLATWEAVIIALSACTVAALLLFFCCLAYMVMVQRRRHYTQKFQDVLRSDPRRGDRQYSYGFDDDLINTNENYRGNYPENRGADGPMFFAKVIDGSESHESEVDSVLDPHIERYGHSMMRMKQPPGPTLLPETALVPYSSRGTRDNRRPHAAQEYSPDLSGNGPSIIYNDMAMH